MDSAMAENFVVDAKAELNRQPLQEARCLLARFMQSQCSWTSLRKAWHDVFILIIWPLLASIVVILYSVRTIALII
jgi:hypothetical protein